MSTVQETGITPAPDRVAGVLLVGNPNVGKSAMFGALTGNYVTVSNYPGTTVEVSRGVVSLETGSAEVVDTPGTNSFLPTTDDERVTRDCLLDRDGHTVVAVGDAKNATRTALLALQLSEMDVPYVLALNMMDEAREKGIEIDLEGLARTLGVGVVPTVAIRREGIEELKAGLGDPRAGALHVPYPEPVEAAIARLIPVLPETSISARGLAVMVLCGDRTLLERIRRDVPADSWATIDRIRRDLVSDYREPLPYVVNRVRLEAAARLVEPLVGGGAGRARPRTRIQRALDVATTHPLWGVPVLGVVLWAAYQFVGVFGAGTLVGLLEEGLFGQIINPAVTTFFDRFLPVPFLRDLLVGEYGILSMALTYSLALVLPIVGTFFIAFGILEDSGYLPRLAVMVNRAMKKIGLNGKAVLPMVLGLGCDTMATLTTRILETRKERLIVIVLLALGVPCSAQLTVILAMLGSMSMLAVGIWLGVVIGVIFLVGRLAARFLPGRTSDFILELPPLRVPRVRNIAIKTLARIEWYLKEAVPLFVLGTLILFVMDRLNMLGAMERAAAPVLNGMLGLPPETAEAFVIGFLRRDFGAAGLYHMAREGSLDPVQVVVAVVTITLFIPCIANFFMIVKERGWKTGMAIAAFIFPFALLVGTALNSFLRAFPLPL